MKNDEDEHEVHHEDEHEAHHEHEHQASHDEAEEDDADHHHHHGDVDPHVWMDPIYMLEAAEHIKEMLQAQFPELSDKLEANYQR